MATIFAIIVLQISFCVDIGNSANTEKKSQKQTTIIKNESTTPSAEIPSPAYLDTSFDMSIEKVIVPCLGHDIEQVYNFFNKQKKSAHKDEFETTEQYQKRLSDQEAEPLFGSVGKDALLAFVVIPQSNYNADSRTLTVSIETCHVWKENRRDKSKLGLDIKNAQYTKKKSMRQNAYGASVEVETTHIKDFQLAISNQSSFETEILLEHHLTKTIFVKRIDMEPAEAKAAKNNFAALILVRPIAPYISDGVFLTEATFEKPFEFYCQYYYVDVSLLEIWIYDKLTGNVITKIKSG